MFEEARRVVARKRVDAEIWQAAQRERRPRKKRGTTYVLSGLVRCAARRYVMAGRPGGSNGQLRVYRCQGRHEEASARHRR